MRPQNWGKFSFMRPREQARHALANTLARIAWSVLRYEKAFDTHRHEVTAIWPITFNQVRD
jgi:hypothetical protein